MVQNVLEVHRKLHAVSFRLRATASGNTNAAHAPAAAATFTAAATTGSSAAATFTTWNTRNSTHTVASPTRISSLSCFLLALGILARPARSRAAKTPRLTYAHVDSEEAWTLAKIARDERLSRSRIAIEVAKGRADDIRRRVIAIDSCRRERRPLSVQAIEICILAGRNVEGPA